MRKKWTTEQARSLRDACAAARKNPSQFMVLDVSVTGFFNYCGNTIADTVIAEGNDLACFIYNWFGDDSPSRFRVRDAMHCLIQSYPNGPSDLERED